MCFDKEMLNKLLQALKMDCEQCFCSTPCEKCLKTQMIELVEKGVEENA